MKGGGLDFRQGGGGFNFVSSPNLDKPYRVNTFFSIGDQWSRRPASGYEYIYDGVTIADSIIIDNGIYHIIMVSQNGEKIN